MALMICRPRVKPNFRVRVFDGEKWLEEAKDLRWRAAVERAQVHARMARRARVVDGFGNESRDVPAAELPAEWWSPPQSYYADREVTPP